MGDVRSNEVPSEHQQSLRSSRHHQSDPGGQRSGLHAGPGRHPRPAAGTELYLHRHLRRCRQTVSSIVIVVVNGAGGFWPACFHFAGEVSTRMNGSWGTYYSKHVSWIHLLTQMVLTLLWMCANIGIRSVPR